MIKQDNINQEEIKKFAQMAHQWWDPNGECKPLHDINPIRLEWIKKCANGIQNKSILDIGCGGGILSESMALAGGLVTGIDMAEASLIVAKLHALESGVQLQYEKILVEDKAKECPNTFDIITCMEMLEHVPHPQSVILSAASLLKPGGLLCLSTLNRQYKAFLLAVFGAEYILNWLPKGTHDYGYFIKPSELAHMVRKAGLIPTQIQGMHYEVTTGNYILGTDSDVNYFMSAIKP